MDDLGAYRCAKLLLDQHGRDAELHAAMRADKLEAAGDEAGRRTWMRILAKVDELARTERRRGEALQWKRQAGSRAGWHASQAGRGLHLSPIPCIILRPREPARFHDLTELAASMPGTAGLEESNDLVRVLPGRHRTQLLPGAEDARDGIGNPKGWAVSLVIGVFLGLLYYVCSAYGFLFSLDALY